MPASIGLHLAVLLLLALIVFRSPSRSYIDSVLLQDDGAAALALTPDLLTPPEFDPQSLPGMFDAAVATSPDAVQMEVDVVELTDGGGGRADRPNPHPPARPAPTLAPRKAGGKASQDAAASDQFAGRKPAAKAGLVKRFGGTAASEASVARGLVWLRNHQLPNGSWNFDHLQNPRCDCSMPGRLASCPNGATALALLAFLGAGHTHEEGDYQDEVRLGLDYLVAHGTPAAKGVQFYGESLGHSDFYAHSLATIALSEALAMTQDLKLRPAAEGAVKFIAATQHSQGGWRYFPGQPGDTSVVAWNVMGLKSAQFSRLTVPGKVFHGVNEFLESVQTERGSRYAYLPQQQNRPTPSMTAAGLLCRMYLGWRENSPGLKLGVHYLDELGPSRDDMYYNYYATQVLHHWGGSEWERWNAVMREQLVRSQIRDGHAAGSWDVADRHGFDGGRLYMTTLAILTLEVYYRHLPLYQRDLIETPLTGDPDAAP